MKNNKTKISPLHLISLIKAWVFGFLIVELISFSTLFGNRLYDQIAQEGFEKPSIIVSVLYVLIILVYMVYREANESLFRLIKSRRIDLFMLLCGGIISNIYIGGIGTDFYKKGIDLLTFNQVLVILSIPFLIFIFFLIYGFLFWLKTKKGNNDSFFVNDGEQKAKEDDLLGYAEIADKFAERIYNQGSSESLVFGVDAPWGVGKSSFINFCKEYWNEKHKDQIIIYTFNPLRYENRDNLLEKYVDGLIKEIQKNIFIPEIRPIISRYAHLIQSIKGNIKGIFELEIVKGNYTVDDAFNDLEATLNNIDQKIIVIIDDLDRLSLSAVKDILFTIKKSFTLPNISYVLCYDAENINSLEEKKLDIEKVTEFLEKFVNVKVSLYLDSLKLSEYASKNIEKLLNGNSQTEPLLVSKAMGALKDIIKSNEFSNYVPFIGDIRKIKRLINTVLLLDIEKADFDNSDINNYDLIHLLLIYINYPNIFRKIYNTETNGKKGFFSLVSEYEEGYPKDKKLPKSSYREGEYQNSTKYTEYIKTVTPSQKFLLNKTFCVSRLENSNIENVPIELKTSLACFNGGIWSSGNTNLEDYLKLIVSSSKPPIANQYKFYSNQKDKLIKGESIENILKDKVFSFEQDESSHGQLWKVFTNSAHEFNDQMSDQLISYIVKNINNYSLFECREIERGLRHSFIFYLIKILDQAGWSDENGNHKDNSEENISGITDWIFGEGKHKNKSILMALSNEKRGILGIYDLFSFRLLCSADRGGDIFNLTHALAKYKNPNAPTEGLTKNIALEEMRIISQKSYFIFKNQYIDKKINLFDVIDKLTFNKLAGKYKNTLQEKVISGDIKDIKTALKTIKSNIKTFITYQIGSSSTEFGITCGYYDPKGTEDKHEISAKMNDYLFNVCFEPNKNNINYKNYEHFLDYLLMSLSSGFEVINGSKYFSHINGFTKILNKDKLYAYWKTHSVKIKSLKYENKNKLVITSNYSASYKEYLLNIYKTLDNFVSEYETPKPTETKAIEAQN